MADATPLVEGSIVGDGKTLVGWSAEWQLSIDIIRRTIRRSDELKALGTQFGPTRVYTRDEAEKIRLATINRPVRPRGRAASPQAV